MSIEKQGLSQIDVRLLVQWLGPIGAAAGLLESKNCPNGVLVAIAKSIGLSPSKSTARRQLVEDIVKVASKRIDKPIEELYKMSKEELVEYFHRIDATSDELLDILRTLELTPRRDGHKGLVELAARELSETGRFLRISTSSGRINEKG